VLALALGVPESIAVLKPSSSGPRFGAAFRVLCVGFLCGESVALAQPVAPTAPPVTTFAPAVPPKATATATATATAPSSPSVAPPKPKAPKPLLSTIASAAPAAPPASAAPEASAALPALSASAEPPVPEAIPSAAEEPPPPASAAPSASAAVAPPPPPPPPSASAPPPPAVIAGGSPVRLGDSTVFLMRVPRAGLTADQRAAAATKALAAALPTVTTVDVRVQRRGDVAVILLGQTPIVQLDKEDAEAAADTSLDVHAASVAAALRNAVEGEKRRAALAKSVFSVSLVVFFGLIAFYLLRKVGELSEKGRDWLDAHGERVLAVRVKQIEVVSPATVRSTAVVALSAGRWIAQGGIVYAWLVVTLSMFDATRGYTEKMTGLVIQPMSQLMGRIALSLPVIFVLLIAAFAVFVLLRFIELFLQSVERRETHLTWLSPDLAAPTSVIVRFGTVTAALLFLAPLVTGNPEGALGQAGVIMIAALGLASTPLLASALLGSVLLFGRRLRVGQHVEIGAARGRITAIDLLEVRIEGADRTELRLPHLYSLRSPLRVLGLWPRLDVLVPVAPENPQADLRELLLELARAHGREPSVELVSLDADRLLYRVSLIADGEHTRSKLQLALFEAMRERGFRLARLTSAERPA
jgi:small-conductance mechanosensitive channel